MWIPLRSLISNEPIGFNRLMIRATVSRRVPSRARTGDEFKHDPFAGPKEIGRAQAAACANSSRASISADRRHVDKLDESWAIRVVCAFQRQPIGQIAKIAPGIM